MIEIDDGGPAFPETRWDDKSRQDVQWCGMTLRAYFAGKAMQGFCANNNCMPTKQYHFDNIAADACQMADAMLKELSK